MLTASLGIRHTILWHEYKMLTVSSYGYGIWGVYVWVGGSYQADSEPPPHGVVCQSLKQQNIILSAKNYLYRFYTWVKLVIVQTRN